MEEKKKSKVLVVTIIVLVLVVLGLTGFIVYDKVLKDNDIEVSGKEETKKDDETKLNVSYETVRGLYEEFMDKRLNNINIQSFDGGFGEQPLLYLLTSEKENILNLYFDYEAKMQIVFSKLEKDNKIKTEYVNKNDIAFIKTIKISDVKEYYGNFFGKDQELVLKNFNEYSTGDCKVSSEDNYVCTYFSGFGTQGSFDGIISFFEDYETDKDSIYIYENVVYSKADGIDEEAKKYKTCILDKDYNRKYETEIKLTDDELLNSEHKKDLRLYKHTFKQNKDGSFYWYSTMPVNR